MPQPPIRDEKVAALEQALRFYVCLSRRLERRAEAAELELEGARHRLAVLGVRHYSSLDED